MDELGEKVELVKSAELLNYFKLLKDLNWLKWQKWLIRFYGFYGVEIFEMTINSFIWLG